MDTLIMQRLLGIQLDSSMGLDIDNMPISGTRPPSDQKEYWAKRSNTPIYLMTFVFAHYYCRRKKTVADVGPHTSPLVLMLPEFEQRFAIDPSEDAAIAWKDVDGAAFINKPLEQVNVEELTQESKFDLITCHQVIEHFEDPFTFAHELCSKARRLIISTTFETPAGLIPSHLRNLKAGFHAK
jgi:2-polyprenyl-3-methyl-5-hydroxy-6-metoxy-1,4-benzoquinol methylase